MDDYLFARCRAIGHRWTDLHIDPDLERTWRLGGGHGRPLSTQCETCSTVKTAIIDWRGVYTRTWRYTYPQGYLWGAKEPVPKADWRIAYLKTLEIRISRRKGGDDE